MTPINKVIDNDGSINICDSNIQRKARSVEIFIKLFLSNIIFTNEYKRLLKVLENLVP